MAVITYDQYAGVELKIETVSAGASITLASAKTDGKVTGYSVQRIQDIDPGKYSAKLNAGFFCDQRNSAIYGEAYGVRCGADEWEVPRQGKFIYYAVIKDGRTEVGYDYDFWYTREKCVCASSPALVLMHNGIDVEWISPSRPDRRTLACCQSVLVRTADNKWMNVISKGNLTPNQIRAWSKTIPGVQDLVFNDGGGSACFTDGEDVYLATGENRKIANCWAFIEEGKQPTVTVPLTEVAGMKGIDISNWQKNLDLTKINYDFVIVKATEGINFVDAYCDKFIQTAKKMGKLWGFYHFARPTNDAVTEAEFFVKNCQNYFGEGIPVLDWEAENKNDVTWALTWLNKVRELTGVKAMIYMSESVVNAYDWTPVVNGDYGLWVAKYRDNQPDYNYDMSAAGTAPKVKWWKGYAMWQWTSCGVIDGYGYYRKVYDEYTGKYSVESRYLDCDIFYGNKDAWMAYAKSSHVLPDTDVPPEGDDNDLQTLLTALRNENRVLEETLADYKKRVEKALQALKGETT